MDFELPEELKMLKQQLRRFVDKEIIPIEREAYEGPDMKPEVRAREEVPSSPDKDRVIDEEEPSMV